MHDCYCHFLVRVTLGTDAVTTGFTEEAVFGVGEFEKGRMFLWWVGMGAL